ncbi:membrane protein PM19L [Selaginella moellendorffii]|uniref:membrane protein PM19L n=1 Tax=Selaginella moellendorffii TaxID=88036 RepID=UPI000D1CCD75|nr:membrane protein PM19L [Selaginella moellendorffii]|eukprot:XP_002980717.2 membrane protein PM19L [Selaginella moellendorffii]
MAMKRGKSSSPLLALLVLALSADLTLLGLASFEVNHQLNDLSALADNNAIFDLVRFSLTAAAVGVASAMIGLLHARHHKHETIVGAVCVGVIALVLLLLAAGFSAKHIILGSVKQDRLKILEALAIVAGGTQLFYVLFLVLEYES